MKLEVDSRILYLGCIVVCCAQLKAVLTCFYILLAFVVSCVVETCLCSLDDTTLATVCGDCECRCT